MADEVRNLAMRAADAAKNTANLIEDTVKKIKEGSDIVEKTGAEFSHVSTSSGKMSELVGEITAASTEQAQGIEQINRAVSEMDRVVQQNAANAEESASASEEMNAQAAQMKSFVMELIEIVGGTANGRSNGGEPVWKDFGRKREKIAAAAQDEPRLRIPAQAQKTGKANGTAGKATSSRTENMIPMQEEELGNF